MSKFETAHDLAWQKLAKELGRDPTRDESDRLEGELFDRWIAERRFDDLIRHVQEAYELEGGQVDLAVLGKGLRDAGEVDRVHTLFRGMLRARSRAFWQSWPEAQKGHLGHMVAAAKHYAATMQAYGEYWHNLWSLGLEAEREALRAEMLRFQAREKPVPASAKRTRGMSDAQFWTLIAEARQDAGSPGQFAAALETSLGASPPKDIQAFDALLRKHLDALQSWDLWAFAHLARGGCPDDSFDYFRAWIVAQGRETFEAAVRGPEALLAQFDDCWDCQCEEFLSVADEVYRAATGEDLPRKVRKAAPLRGTRWQEEELASRFPEVVRRFAAG